jgi:hypothetical protein
MTAQTPPQEPAPNSDTPYGATAWPHVVNEQPRAPWYVRGGHDLAAAGIAVAVSIVLGPITGLLWELFAPKPGITVTEGGPYWTNPESKKFIAQDGYFAGITLAAGLLVALVVFLLARRGGIGAAVGLTIGGIGGSLICLGTGYLVGPGNVIDASQSALTFDAPLALRAAGLLFAWPLAAVVLHFLLHVLFGPREDIPYERRPDLSGLPPAGMPRPPASAAG